MSRMHRQEGPSMIVLKEGLKVINIEPCFGVSFPWFRILRQNHFNENCSIWFKFPDYTSSCTRKLSKYIGMGCYMHAEWQDGVLKGSRQKCGGKWNVWSKLELDKWDVTKVARRRILLQKMICSYNSMFKVYLFLQKWIPVVFSVEECSLLFLMFGEPRKSVDNVTRGNPWAINYLYTVVVRLVIKIVWDD